MVQWDWRMDVLEGRAWKIWGSRKLMRVLPVISVGIKVGKLKLPIFLYYILCIKYLICLCLNELWSQIIKALISFNFLIFLPTPAQCMTLIVV